MELYHRPRVRPDGRWLRPLLPEGATPLSTFLLVLLSAVMLWALSSSLPDFMRYALWTTQVLSILGITTAVFIAWYWLAPTWRRAWFAFPVLIIAGLFLLVRYAPWVFGVVNGYIFDIITTIIQARTGQLDIIPLNVGVLIIAVSHFLLLWALVVTVWRRPWTPTFLLVGSLVFVWEWLFFFDPAFHHAVLFLTAGTLLLVVRHQLLVNKQWEVAAQKAATESVESRSLVSPALLSGTLMVLTISLSAQLLPSSFSPANTGVVGAWFEHAFPVLSELRGGGGEGRSTRFALSHTGFATDDRQLGGPVVLDEQKVMTVRLEGRSLPRSLYLRGAVREFYTASGWQLAPQPTKQVLLRTTLPKSQDSSVETTSIRQTIRYVGLRTSSLFAVLGPYIIREFTPTQWEGVFADPGLDLWAPDVLDVGQEYVVDSVVPVYALDQLHELSIDDKSLLAGDATQVDAVAGAFEDADYVSRYLQLPPELPSRVADLARRITTGLTDPVDQALALNDFLRRNYRYTLNPPPVPNGADFVDNFLFNEQQGYCTYHSTALAVMLRTLGIPSRWVIGYVVTDRQRAQLVSNVEYTVTNATAHAWVEALIPGYGWLSLDPTPRFGGFEILRELPSSSSGSQAGQESDSTGGAALPNGERIEDLDPGIDQTPALPVQRRPIWAYVAALLGLVLLGFVGTLTTRLVRSYKADRLALTGPSGVSRLYAHVCSMLEQLGADLPPGLTAREVLRAIRTRRDYPQELVAALESLVLLLESRLYAEVDVSAQELQQLDYRWREALAALQRAYGLRQILHARLVVGANPPT